MDSAQILTIRLEKPLLKVMEKDMKEFHYPTKSDFLREAIREKHLKLEDERRKERMIEALKKLRGSYKPKKPLSDEEFERMREKVGEESFARDAKKFGLDKELGLKL